MMSGTSFLLRHDHPFLHFTSEKSRRWGTVIAPAKAVEKVSCLEADEDDSHSQHNDAEADDEGWKEQQGRDCLPHRGTPRRRSELRRRRRLSPCVGAQHFLAGCTRHRAAPYFGVDFGGQFYVVPRTGPVRP